MALLKTNLNPVVQSVLFGHLEQTLGGVGRWIKMENLAVGDRPSWLSDALFKGILEKTAEGDVQIYDVKVEAAVSKGENYSSQMYRVTLKYIQGPQMGFRWVFTSIFSLYLITFNFPNFQINNPQLSKVYSQS